MAPWTQVCISVPTKQGIYEMLEQVHNFILTYPGLCATLLLIWSYYPELPFTVAYDVFYVVPRAIFGGILDVLGFREEGIERDTWASNYQSRNYGGYVPPGSFFSTYQSYGAVSASDVEINWVTGEIRREGSRGVLMTTLSYVLFICACVVLYEGFKARI